MPNPVAHNTTPVRFLPGERLYTIEELVDVHLTVPVYDDEGRFTHYRRLFGRSFIAQQRFVKRYLSQTREPGKIWARRLGKDWLIPERSFFDFMRGDFADDQCPTCGAQLITLLSGDLDLLLRLKNRLESVELAEKRREEALQKEIQAQRALEAQEQRLKDERNPTLVYSEDDEEELTEQHYI